jgi:hypothetical protein
VLVFVWPQNELVTSLKSLLKHIDNTQLTADLEGSFHYDHKHWLTFRQVGDLRV